MGYFGDGVSMLRAIYTNKSVQFIALMGLWLAAYKLATLLDVFRPYSSLWFLPAGITLSIALGAPGWLKLAPFAANMSLVSPDIAQFIIEDNGGAVTQALHAIRHCGIYGLAAYGLIRFAGESWLTVTLRSTLAYVVLVLVAAAAAAIAGVSLHVWAGNMSWATAWSIVVQWAIGDAVAALVLPPILVPLLRRILAPSARAEPENTQVRWVVQLGFVMLAIAVGSQAGKLNPELGSLWYLALIPPIFAGVAGGFSSAAFSVFITSLATPIAAYMLSYSGEMVALSLLLTIGAIAALLVGAAVSDQRRALAAVIGQSEKLEETVAVRTSELSDAYQFQRHLVRSLGHDLRQPLHTLTMLIEGMAMRATFDADALAGAKQISTGMGGFLDGILNYARHDPGVISPNLQVVAVSKIFAQLQNVYGPIAQQRNVRLVVRPSDALLVSDELLLLQGLSNDLDNAIRLSKANGVVELRHEVRNGLDALMVVDNVVAPKGGSPGAAGFGQGIVARVCAILGATRLEETGLRGILLKPLLPTATQEAHADTSNS
ncbi:MAG: hypothetical protein ABS76_15265 [Pelagibacterium sp. SCN 64-44]|nr:MAG: hypothetical protein ABS76_15265 [Pelagibacterium sp. SCN 64-44]